MDKAQVRLPASLAFAASARRVLVGKSQPDKTDPRRPAELGQFGCRGLVRAEARIAVGERVFERGTTGLRLPSGEPVRTQPAIPTRRPGPDRHPSRLAHP